MNTPISIFRHGTKYWAASLIARVSLSLLIIACVCLGLPSATATVVYDDFNDGAIGDWVVTAPAGTSVGASAAAAEEGAYGLGLVDTCSSQSASAGYIFGTQTGIVAADFSVRMSNDVLPNYFVTQMKSGSLFGPRIRFNAGNIQYCNGAAWTTAQAFSPNTWYRFIIVADIIANTYNLYINDALRASSAAFYNGGLTSLDRISFATSMFDALATGTMHVDGVTILLKHPGLEYPARDAEGYPDFPVMGKDAAAREQNDFPTRRATGYDTLFKLKRTDVVNEEVNKAGEWYLVEQTKGVFDFSDLQEAIQAAGDAGLWVAPQIALNMPPSWFIAEFPDCGLKSFADEYETSSGTRRLCPFFITSMNTTAQNYMKRYVDNFMDAIKDYPNVIGVVIGNYRLSRLFYVNDPLSPSYECFWTWSQPALDSWHANVNALTDPPTDIADYNGRTATEKLAYENWVGDNFYNLFKNRAHNWVVAAANTRGLKYYFWCDSSTFMYNDSDKLNVINGCMRSMVDRNRQGMADNLAGKGDRLAVINSTTIKFPHLSIWDAANARSHGLKWGGENSSENLNLGNQNNLDAYVGDLIFQKADYISCFGNSLIPFNVQDRFRLVRRIVHDNYDRIPPHDPRYLNWAYRRYIPVEAAKPDSKRPVEVGLTFDAGKVKADGADFRLLNDAGDEIPYQLNNIVASGGSLVSCRLIFIADVKPTARPDDPTINQSQPHPLEQNPHAIGDHYLYYGNPNAPGITYTGLSYTSNSGDVTITENGSTVALFDFLGDRYRIVPYVGGVVPGGSSDLGYDSKFYYWKSGDPEKKANTTCSQANVSYSGPLAIGVTWTESAPDFDLTFKATVYLQSGGLPIVKIDEEIAALNSVTIKTGAGIWGFIPWFARKGGMNTFTVENESGTETTRNSSDASVDLGEIGPKRGWLYYATPSQGGYGIIPMSFKADQGNLTTPDDFYWSSLGWLCPSPYKGSAETSWEGQTLTAGTKVNCSVMLRGLATTITDVPASMQALLDRLANVNTHVKLNIQPKADLFDLDRVGGWLSDHGESYDQLRSFGWSADKTAVVQTRGVNSDPLLDTLISTSNAQWNLDLADGTYFMSSSVGDPEFAAGPHHVTINGVVLYGGQTTPANSFLPIDWKTVAVTGRNVYMNVGSTGQAALNYLTLRPVPTHFNFQDCSSQPAGYIGDFGAPYDPERAHGWVTDVLANGRRRGVNTDPLLDTFIFVEPNATASWEVRVDNGTYLISLACGDASFARGPHRVLAEGTTVVNDVTTAANGFHTVADQPITVADGKLTITIGGANGHTMLNYIRIVPQ